jgi:hypothetical protein
MQLVLDQVNQDLQRLIEADLGPLNGASLKDAFLDWLHYRARKIPQRPREVVLSSEVQAYRAAYPAITRIELALRNGEDVTPWLSTRIVRSAGNPRADMMFNDWQVMHFHLGDLLTPNGMVARTANLLFAHISADRAVFLDVQPHGAWSMINLLRILLRTWPAAMERFEYRGIVDMDRQRTDEEIFGLRSNGIAVTISLDGRFFMAPGMGVMTSRHSLRLVLLRDAFFQMVDTTLAQARSGQFEHLLGYSPLVLPGAPLRVGVPFHHGHLETLDPGRGLGLMRMRPVE